MMRIAYLDCVGGISGDMTLGALIDAGVNAGELVGTLRTLPLQGFEIAVREEVRGGWRGTRVIISQDGTEQPHRHLEQILSIIDGGNLPGPVKDNAVRVFQRLAEAEGRVHGIEPERVHFHEVGAVDSILDIVGSCLGLFLLGVESLHCSPLPTGYGTIRCAHGIMPVPAPATAELLKGLPLRPVNVEGELVTPTGAALASTLAHSFGPMPAMQLENTGYGLGSRDYALPNYLRLFVGHKLDEQRPVMAAEEEVLVLETDVDDMNPEWLPYVDGLLRQAGALDVFLLPSIMKKGRPGTRMSVLCPRHLQKEMLEIIFRETTTLGVRTRLEQRHILQRKLLPVTTPWGTVNVKIGYLNGDQPVQISPEYEDCRQAAGSSGVPIQEIYHFARQAALKQFSKTL